MKRQINLSLSQINKWKLGEKKRLSSRREQIKAGYIKAKPTKCNSYIQIKDGWLGLQGLVSSKYANDRGKNCREESKVHICP